MKTLVTAIQAGGQGKTFATCHLAFYFSERDLKVVVIDLATQGNASFTLAGHETDFAASRLFSGDEKALKEVLSSREKDDLVLLPADPGLANLEKMDLGQAAASLKKAIQVLSEFFDVCLIDTPPSLGVVMTSAVICSDYMLSPLEMESYSLQGMKKMASVVGNLRKLNPTLKFLGMLPNKVDSRKPRHVANLAAVKQAYPQLVLPVSIGARDSIAEALGEQMPVWKIKKNAARIAAKEVRELAACVLQKMDIEEAA
jgi:chromosome partitioning protein